MLNNKFLCCLFISFFFLSLLDISVVAKKAKTDDTEKGKKLSYEEYIRYINNSMSKNGGSKYSHLYPESNDNDAEKIPHKKTRKGDTERVKIFNTAEYLRFINNSFHRDSESKYTQLLPEDKQNATEKVSHKEDKKVHREKKKKPSGGDYEMLLNNTSSRTGASRINYLRPKAADDEAEKETDSYINLMLHVHIGIRILGKLAYHADDDKNVLMERVNTNTKLKKLKKNIRNILTQKIYEMNYDRIYDIEVITKSFEMNSTETLAEFLKRSRTALKSPVDVTVILYPNAEWLRKSTTKFMEHSVRLANKVFEKESADLYEEIKVFLASINMNIEAHMPTAAELSAKTLKKMCKKLNTLYSNTTVKNLISTNCDAWTQFYYQKKFNLDEVIADLEAFKKQFE